MPAAGGPVHSVSFRYSFDGEPSVRISGLGAMPATGELSYLTPDAVIRFTAADGRLLESIDLKNATELMGEAASATPARSDFPDNARYGFWKQKAPFTLHALKVLNQQFTAGILPTFTDVNGESVLISAYQPLTGLPEDLFGEVAVLVSHGEERPNQELSFRVRWNTREKRKLTRWRSPASPPTERAAQAFVARILATLGAPER